MTGRDWHTTPDRPSPAAADRRIRRIRRGPAIDDACGKTDKLETCQQSDPGGAVRRETGVARVLQVP